MIHYSLSLSVTDPLFGVTPEGCLCPLRTMLKA